MSGKLDGDNVINMDSGESSKGVSDGAVVDLESKTLTENDRGKSADGARVSEEAGGLAEKSNVGAVNSGFKWKDFGYIDDKHDESKNRVVELMSGDDGWGMMDLVGRVLNGDFGRDEEVKKRNISGGKPEINLVVDLGTIGKPTSANGTMIDNCVDDMDSGCHGEGNGLCENPDLVTNEQVPGGKLDIEGVNIADADVYNDKRTDMEDSGEVITLNGKQGFLTNEQVPGGKVEIEGVNIAEVGIDNDKRADIEDSGEGTTLNGKQDFLTNELVPAGNSKMEAVKIGEADVAITKRNGGYFVSDLVWGKVRSHPWWPGQIFAPSAASDRAMKYFKKDSYLIAYFGDQTFAWNDVSKIKPFQVNFTEMEKQGNTEEFTHAVSCAIDEVSRRVEVGMLCTCLPVGVRDNIKTQFVANAGIREESSRREGRDNSFTAASFLPGETLQLVESFAVAPNLKSDRLQFTILKAQLLAFNRWRGLYQLPVLQQCGYLVDEDTQFTTEAEGTDSKEVNEGVLAASDIASEVPSRKRKSTIRDDTQTVKKTGRKKTPSLKKQESFVSGSKEKRKQILLSSSAIDNMDLQPKKKPRVGKHGTFADSGAEKSQTLEMIETMTLTPDETLEKLTLIAKEPMQEHDNTMMQTVGFLREYRNSICLEKSSAHGQTELDGKNKGKQAADIFGFEGTEDTYWTDRVIQGYSQPQVLFELDNPTEIESSIGALVDADNKNESDTVIVVSDTESPSEDYCPTSLILNFTNLESIPSITRLNEIFRPYGPLKESDTKVLSKSNRAKVIFKKRADAETAFSSTGKYSIFGPSLVSYRLNYAPTPRKAKSTSKWRNKKTQE